jgi:plastocyanin
VHRKIYLAALLIATGVLAACGGPTSATPATPATATPATATPATATPATASPATVAPAMSGTPAMSMPATQSPTGAPVATSTVAITNFAFSPATVTVKAGTTVTWTNKDEEAHTVTAQDKSFASPPLDAGQTYTHTFTAPGTYAYLCTIHPFMTAVVVVTP